MNSLFNFLLRIVLSVGRSDDDRVSLLGDLVEEHRNRLASGSGRLAAFAWYAAEIVHPLAWGLREAVVRRAFAPPRFAFSWPDIKLSLRLLIRNPGLTVVSSVGITVGIAITAGMFGFLHEIVGVAENLLRNPIDPDVVRSTVLYPVAPEALASATLTLRLRGSASRMDEGFARKLHQIFVAVDPALRMGQVRRGAVADGQAALAIRLVALALFLILVTVLLFSAAGVYSLMSFTVAQRRREIGIRAALGASSLGLLRSIFCGWPSRSRSESSLALSERSRSHRPARGRRWLDDWRTLAPSARRPLQRSETPTRRRWDPPSVRVTRGDPCQAPCRAANSLDTAAANRRQLSSPARNRFRPSRVRW